MWRETRNFTWGWCKVWGTSGEQLLGHRPWARDRSKWAGGGGQGARVDGVGGVIDGRQADSATNLGSVCIKQHPLLSAYCIVYARFG